MEEKSKGSVYQQWHAALLGIYIETFKRNMRILKELPSSEFSIPEGDIADLLRVAQFFGVEIPENANLKDLKTFKKYLGVIDRESKKMVLVDLKPIDPYAQVIQQLGIGEHDIRQMEGESI